MYTSLNPGDELNQIITGWVNNNQAAVAKRDLDKATAREKHFRAIRCLEDIGAMLESADKTAQPYRDAFPDWVKTVFHFAGDWRDNKSSMPATSLALLSVLPPYLASLMGSQPLNVEAIMKNQKPINQLVEAFKATVDNDSTLDLEFKRHVARLADHILTLLDDLQHGGGFRLSEAFAMLRLYTDAAAERSTDTEKTSWYRKTRDAAFNFAKSIGGQAAVHASTAALMELTSGVIPPL